MPINPTPELQQRLGRLEFLAHQAVEGFITGMHKSPFHGFSVEFAEHRLHNPGESTKHLDWKLYARTDKMFVKRYEEETNLRCQLVIDSSTSMAYPDGVTLDGDRMSKLKFAVLASAALIELFRRQRDAVGLSLFNEALDLQTPARSSRAHHRMLYDKLEGLLEASPDRKETKAIDALHQIAEATPRRSFVLLFSDLLDKSEDPDALISALQHLRHNKHEVVVFHLLEAETELDFGFVGQAHAFCRSREWGRAQAPSIGGSRNLHHAHGQIDQDPPRQMWCPRHRLGGCRCRSGSSARVDELPDKAGQTFLTETHISFVLKGKTLLSLRPDQSW